MPRYSLVPLLLTMFGVASCAALKPQPLAPAAPPPAQAAPLPPAETPAPPLAFFPPVPRPEQPYFIQDGIASFYGKAHQGKRTAAGEHFNLADFTAAHPTLPFGTVVRVTNLHNGMVVKVRINDRGPHVKGRVIDLSVASARAAGHLGTVCARADRGLRLGSAQRLPALKARKSGRAAEPMTVRTQGMQKTLCGNRRGVIAGPVDRWPSGLKAHAWKGCNGDAAPRVRIPLRPPSIAHQRSALFNLLPAALTCAAPCRCECRTSAWFRWA